MSRKVQLCTVLPMINSIMDIHPAWQVKDFKPHARKHATKRNSLKIRKEQ